MFQISKDARIPGLAKHFMPKTMNRKKGFTLIELMIVTVIAAIAMLGVSFILVNAYRDLRASRQIKSLQENMDLASYTVKSLIEEADEFEIDTETGERINIKYTDEDSEVVWEKEIYMEDSNLMLEDIMNDNIEIIIGGLEAVSFEDAGNNTIRVVLTVAGGGRTVENSFLVRMRNR